MIAVSIVATIKSTVIMSVIFNCNDDEANNNIITYVCTIGGKGRESDSAQSSLNVGNVLSSMISCGLKDEQKDAFQIWREVCTHSHAYTHTHTHTLSIRSSFNDTIEFWDFNIIH